MEGIAARYGLTVEQVYALVEREVNQPGPPPVPGHYGPPVYQSPVYQPPVQYGPPVYQPPVQAYAPPVQAVQWSPYEDAIVADYGAGRDVAEIARKFGITVEQVYEVVQRNLATD